MRANQQQSEAWNGPESAHYVDHADCYDRQLAPVTEALLERAAIEPSHVVLDVACGSGATTLIAARQADRVVGVDISEPLTRLATQRAQLASVDNAEFVVADVQTHEFDDGGFDLAISQFGLMFFDDPVAAFSNLRRALHPGGRLVFSAWQGLTVNEWLAPVVRAVGQYGVVPDLGGLANGGGMFALEHEAEIEALLGEAGFVDVEVDAIAPTVLLGGGGDLEESVEFLVGMGIVRGLLSHIDSGQRASAINIVRDELAGHYEPGVGVGLGVGVWLVSARSPGLPARRGGRS